MDEKTARRMDRLLARGKMSAPEADEIEERIYATLDREKPSKVIPIQYWGSAVVATAAALLLVIVVPRDPIRPGIDETGDLPGLRVTCEGGTLSACPMSAKLVFEVTGKEASGFLSAYAEPIGHEGERVFYYSKEDGSVKLPGGSSVRQVGLMKTGRYRVHAVIAEVPLAREELVRTSGLDAGRKVRSKVQIEIVVTR